MLILGRQWQLRDKESFVNYVKIEIQLLLKEWKIILPCAIMQYVHAIFHNLAYYIQGNKLKVEQRFTLYDLGFEALPELHGLSSSISDILVFSCIFGPAIFLILTIPFCKQERGRPRYLVIVLKRCLMQISICLILRIISFLSTSLPSPADHCELKFDDACLAANPGDRVSCIVTNPNFQPPHLNQLFTRLDALNGCGDLMFSSHTIYTVSFILTMWKYWLNKYGLMLVVSIQIVIAFLIVASRRHYTVDVFTALYVVPLVWFTLEAYYVDINHKDSETTVKTIFDHYGVDVSSDANGGAVLANANDAIPDATGSLQMAMTVDESIGDDSAMSFQRKNSV